MFGAIPLVAAAVPHGTGSVAISMAGVVLYQEVENRLISAARLRQALRPRRGDSSPSRSSGGELMGIVGALLALPVTAGVRMIVEELRIELPGAEDDRSRD